MQKWVENYPFLAMPANANAIAMAQCERTLRDETGTCRRTKQKKKVF